MQRLAVGAHLVQEATGAALVGLLGLAKGLEAGTLLTLASTGVAASCLQLGELLPLPGASIPSGQAVQGEGDAPTALALAPWEPPKALASHQLADGDRLAYKHEGWRRVLSCLTSSCAPSPRAIMRESGQRGLSRAGSGPWHVVLVPLAMGPDLLGAMLLALPGEAAAGPGPSPPPLLHALLTKPGALEELGACVAECCLGPVLPAVSQVCCNAALLASCPTVHLLSTALTAALVGPLSSELFVDFGVRLALLPHKDAARGILFDDTSACARGALQRASRSGFHLVNLQRCASATAPLDTLTGAPPSSPSQYRLLADPAAHAHAAAHTLGNTGTAGVGPLSLQDTGPTSLGAQRRSRGGGFPPLSPQGADAGPSSSKVALVQGLAGQQITTGGSTTRLMVLKSAAEAVGRAVGGRSSAEVSLAGAVLTPAYPGAHEGPPSEPPPTTLLTTASTAPARHSGRGSHPRVPPRRSYTGLTAGIRNVSGAGGTSGNGPANSAGKIPGLGTAASAPFRIVNTGGGSASTLLVPREQGKASTFALNSTLAASILAQAIAGNLAAATHTSTATISFLCDTADPAYVRATGNTRTSPNQQRNSAHLPNSPVSTHGPLAALHEACAVPTSLPPSLRLAGAIVASLPAYLQDATQPSDDICLALRRGTSGPNPNASNGGGAGTLSNACSGPLAVPPACLVAVGGCWIQPGLDSEHGASATATMGQLGPSSGRGLSTHGGADVDLATSTSSSGPPAPPALLVYLTSQVSLPRPLLAAARDRVAGLLEVLLPAALHSLQGPAIDDWALIRAVALGLVSGATGSTNAAGSCGTNGTLGAPTTASTGGGQASAAGTSSLSNRMQPASPLGFTTTTMTTSASSSAAARLSRAGARAAAAISAAVTSVSCSLGTATQRHESTSCSTAVGSPPGARVARPAVPCGEVSRPDSLASTMGFDSMVDDLCNGITGVAPSVSVAGPGMRGQLSNALTPGGTMSSTVLSQALEETEDVRQAQLGLMVSTFATELQRVRHVAAGPGGLHAEDDVRALQLMRAIGKGGSSVAFLATLHSLRVAIKVIFPDEDDPNAPAAKPSAMGSVRPSSAKQRRTRQLLQGVRELAVMTSISHPNIVQVYSYCTRVLVPDPPSTPGEVPRLVVVPEGDPTPGPLCTVLIMEYCDMGSLADAIDTGLFVKSAKMAAAALARDHRSASGAFAGPAAAAAAAADASGASRTNRTLGMVVTSAASAAATAGGPIMRAVYLTLLEVALALRHLHSMGLVHCDVKPANVLLRSSATDPRGFTAKLTDFGFVNLLDQPTPEEEKPWPDEGEERTTNPKRLSNRATLRFADRAGTVTHMAPELFLQGRSADSSIDVFALGILMWELYTGRAPYQEYAGNGFQEVPYKVVRDGMRPRFPTDAPVHFKMLAQECWATSPEKRPSAAAVVTRLQQLLDLCCKAALFGSVGAQGDKQMATQAAAPQFGRMTAT
ncbi:hypothetical protein HYH03_007638 [Edaphochlamys debaryana]|uniref:Protein kinase domain-containing protein n=1 Tax=Edaphochlamys debaryana TaxID=47281 RepID=A0A835Y8D1_9CHLO|nr:hypothetical protein HYH03_007638 [Edaphochlamys debaryana]|eukprot:KAG2494285.1 hypothetical protein HYH03_007638 [Edaphochlamys debaryana]